MFQWNIPLQPRKNKGKETDEVLLLLSFYFILWPKPLFIVVFHLPPHATSCYNSLIIIYVRQDRRAKILCVLLFWVGLKFANAVSQYNVAIFINNVVLLNRNVISISIVATNLECIYAQVLFAFCDISKQLLVNK